MNGRTRLVQGFNMQPAGLPNRLYPVDHAMLAADLSHDPAAPTGGAQLTTEYAEVGEDGQLKRRWANEFNVGVGSKPMCESRFSHEAVGSPAGLFS